jgi:hypothetical protein
MNAVRVATAMNLKFCPPRSYYEMHLAYRVPKSKHGARIARLNLPVARSLRVISGVGEELCTIRGERLAAVQVCGGRDVKLRPSIQGYPTPPCREARNVLKKLVLVAVSGRM